MSLMCILIFNFNFLFEAKEMALIIMYYYKGYNPVSSKAEVILFEFVTLVLSIFYFLLYNYCGHTCYVTYKIEAR